MKSAMHSLWLAIALFPGAARAEGLQPRKVSPEGAKGAIFSSPEVQVETREGERSADVRLLLSSDKRAIAGIYKAGPGTFNADPYPVDEFMYFLSGAVTLTSEDGKVMKIGPGDAVTIPKGWKGTWSTTGYSKYYMVYGSGKVVD